MQTLLGAAIDGVQRFPLTAIAVVIAAIVANFDIADRIDINTLNREKIYPALAALRALEGVVKDPQGNPFKPVDGDTKWKLQARLEKAFEVSAARQEKENHNFNLAAKLVSVEGFDLFHSDFSFYPKAKTQLQADLTVIASTNAIYIIRAGIDQIFAATAVGRNVS